MNKNIFRCLLVLMGLYMPFLYGAEAEKTIGIINLTGDAGRNFTANKKNSFEYRGGRPGVAHINAPTKNLPAYYQSHVIQSLEKAGHIQIKELNLSQISEEDQRYIVDGSARYKLKRGALEKLAKLGRNNNADFLLYIAPVDDRYAISGDGNVVWYVRTRNVGFIYAWTNVVGYLTFTAHLIDVKTRALLASEKLGIYKRLDMERKRGLTDEVKKAIVDAVNSEVILKHNMISVDTFPSDRLQTEDEIAEIVSRFSEEEDEDLINRLTQLMEPGHHTIEEYNELPADVRHEIWQKLSSGNEEQFDKVVSKLLKSLEDPEPEPDDE